MSNIKYVVAFAGIVSLTGCATPYSETPQAKNFPTTSQEKLQAASHWRLITDDLYKKMQASMVGKIEKSQPLYVSAKDTSAFNKAVVAELTYSLVADGYTVLKNGENVIKIDVDTQVLEFSPSRLKAKKVGLLTAIATGLWAVTEAGGPITTAGVATVAVAGSEALTYMNSDQAAGETPKTEIIINIAALDANRYIAVSRGSYYVSDTDKGLYQASQARAFTVRGVN